MGPISTPLLLEFLVAVSSAADQLRAVQIATERASHSLDAEVGSVLFGSSVEAVLGFPTGMAPERELAEVAAGVRASLHVPGAGDCHVVVARIGGEPEGHMLLARSGQDAFTVEEIHLVRAMARMLELTLGTIRTLEQERSLRVSLQERQRLLEQLSAIQRAIARREPLAQILQMITASAQEMMGGVAGIVDLRLLAAHKHKLDHAVLACDDELPAELALRLGRISFGSATEIADQLGSAISAPVYENGVFAGNLSVTSCACEPSSTIPDVDTLRAFADQVSLAITEAQTLQQMQEAFHDSLTGLASRRLFLERVEHGLYATQSSDRQIAVLFIDLDRFKLVNDTLGHGAGDDLLIQVAHRLREAIRSCDVAARLGGDEFAVLLADVTSVKLPAAIAQRILDALSGPFIVAGRDVFIDASIGIALGAAGIHTAEGMIRNADLAMYVAKQNGRGRHQLFHESMAVPLRNRVQLDADLHRALDNNELLLHYQPIVKLSDGEVVGAEALLRWQHPSRGLIPPLEFIPLAEETGLIVPIGRWILREACQQAARWQAAPRTGSPLFVSVNLSTRQLQDARLSHDVTAALNASGLSPGLLKLEITETSLLNDSETAVVTLAVLRQHGVCIAMDDFGTGYSSLTNLRRLPIDVLKIDRSFVAEIGTDAEAASFACSIVSLARSLGLVTIAEAIENESQLRTLFDSGCDLGQGYHFMPPLDAKSFLSLAAGACSRLGAPSRHDRDSRRRRRALAEVAR